MPKPRPPAGLSVLLARVTALAQPQALILTAQAQAATSTARAQAATSTAQAAARERATVLVRAAVPDLARAPAQAPTPITRANTTVVVPALAHTDRQAAHPAAAAAAVFGSCAVS